MVDYTKSTGGAGTLVIRDSGGKVSFLLRCTDPQTRNYDGVPWSGYLNGSISNKKVAFPQGAGEVTAKGATTVSTSQTVRFNIGDSGTWGIGGPTTFSVAISRSSEPDKPSNLHLDNAWITKLDLDWTRGDLNGGSHTYDQVQVSSRKQTGTGNFTGTVEITDTTSSSAFSAQGLLPGVLYYVHVRTRTSIGWGPWSDIKTFRTRTGLEVKHQGTYKPAILYVKHEGVYKKAILYGRKDGVYEASRS